MFLPSSPLKLQNLIIVYYSDFKFLYDLDLRTQIESHLPHATNNYESNHCSLTINRTPQI